MGPNHFTLKDGGASCGICGTKNALGNLRRMSIQEVTEPSEIIVCFTQSGTRGRSLHIDCKKVLGPWIRFQSAETLERATVYLARRKSRSRHRRACCGKRGRQQSRPIGAQSKGPAEDRLGKAIAGSKWIEFCGCASHRCRLRRPRSEALQGAFAQGGHNARVREPWLMRMPSQGSLAAPRLRSKPQSHCWSVWRSEDGLIRHTSKLPLPRAISWWTQYVWNAFRMYRYARPQE
jgi:hypothetical protein